MKKAYNEDREKLKNYSIVLYEQARLLEGLSTENTQEFVLALSSIIS